MEAPQLERWRWLTGQKRGREKWLALLLLPPHQKCPYPLLLLCPSSCDLKTLLHLISPHHSAYWKGKRTTRRSCHEAYVVRKMIMQRSKWLEQKLSEMEDRVHTLRNHGLSWRKILNNRGKTVVQTGYLLFTFISRTILTVTVSHPLLTLEVYGTARIRVLCGKRNNTLQLHLTFLAIYKQIQSGCTLCMNQL